MLLAVGRRTAAEEKGAACEPDGTLRVAVRLQPPPGEGLAGVKVVLGYPKSVNIPGFESQPDVRARVTETPDGFFMAPNDTDRELIVAIAGTTALPAGQIFTVDFDRCRGTPGVPPSTFACTVEQASTVRGVLVEGAKCIAQIAKGASSLATPRKRGGKSR